MHRVLQSDTRSADQAIAIGLYRSINCDYKSDRNSDRAHKTLLPFCLLTPWLSLPSCCFALVGCIARRCFGRDVAWPAKSEHVSISLSLTL